MKEKSIRVIWQGVMLKQTIYLLKIHLKYEAIFGKLQETAYLFLQSKSQELLLCRDDW